MKGCALSSISLKQLGLESEPLADLEPILLPPSHTLLFPKSLSLKSKPQTQGTRDHSEMTQTIVKGAQGPLSLDSNIPALALPKDNKGSS